MDRLVQSIDNVRLTDAEDAGRHPRPVAAAGRTEYRVLSDAESLREAIFSLRVRGAPAIGICAGYGMYLLARRIKTESVPEFLAKLRACKDYLDAARPTAVNLSWATARMVPSRRGERRQAVRRSSGSSGRSAAAFRRRTRRCAARSRSTASRSSATATGAHSTATPAGSRPPATGRQLGPLLLGTERGMRFRVFADETRPLLQGRAAHHL